MRIIKDLGTKLLKLSNMDDIICEAYDAIDDNDNPVLLTKDVFQIHVLNGANPTRSLMSITPWIPFAKQSEMVPIYYDSVITITNPNDGFSLYYQNIKKKWRDEIDDEMMDLVSREDELDSVRGPTDEELDSIELEDLLEEAKNKVFH